MTRRETVQLLALLASFVVAGYAAVRLLAGNPIGVGTWFVGSAIGHDLLLFPLYAGLDGALVMLLRRRPELATVGGVRWLNYLRVPAAVSGVLLLVWSPLILRLPTAFHEASGLSDQPLLPHWLAVTAALFAISAAVLVIRTAMKGERHHEHILSGARRRRRRARAGRGRPLPRPGRLPGQRRRGR